MITIGRPEAGDCDPAKALVMNEKEQESCRFQKTRGSVARAPLLAGVSSITDKESIGHIIMDLLWSSFTDWDSVCVLNVSPGRIHRDHGKVEGMRWSLLGKQCVYILYIARWGLKVQWYRLMVSARWVYKLLEEMVARCGSARGDGLVWETIIVVAGFDDALFRTSRFCLEVGGCC